MKRREALSTLSVIGTGTVILPHVILSGCAKEPHKYDLFHWGDTEILNEISDTIIPDTPGVPGAKAANVGEFIQSYVTNCFDEVDQQVFLDGYSVFKINIEQQFGKDFISLNNKQRSDVIAAQEAENSEYQVNNDIEKPVHFYHLLKRMVLFGYFTSETGATKALQYVPIPGYQKGEIPYRDERSWAL